MKLHSLFSVASDIGISFFFIEMMFSAVLNTLNSATVNAMHKCLSRFFLGFFPLKKHNLEIAPKEKNLT